MTRLEDILIKCIDEIKTGKASLTDCLERYPEHRHELEPLLRIAISIKEPPDIKPSDAFKSRARANLMEYIHTSQAKEREIKSVTQSSPIRFWNMGWSRAVAIIVAVILFISMAGTGVAYASQSSLPGDTLYAVKLGTEQFQRLITFDDMARVELELKFTDTRLQEMEITSNKHPDKIYEALTGYEKSLNTAIETAKQVENRETALELVALTILNHLTVLDKVEDNASITVVESIRNCREIAINGHMQTLLNLAEINPVKATEINLEAIQNRLNRAKTQAEKGNNNGVEDALQEYERLRRFIDEISDSAQQMGYDTVSVNTMNAQSTAGQLEMLGSIYENVSQEMKGTVEQTMGVTVEEHTQAVNKLQEQNALGEIPVEPPIPENIPDEVQNDIRQQGSGGSGNGQH